MTRQPADMRDDHLLDLHGRGTTPAGSVRDAARARHRPEGAQAWAVSFLFGAVTWTGLDLVVPLTPWPAPPLR